MDNRGNHNTTWEFPSMFQFKVQGSIPLTHSGVVAAMIDESKPIHSQHPHVQNLYYFCRICLLRQDSTFFNSCSLCPGTPQNWGLLNRPFHGTNFPENFDQNYPAKWEVLQTRLSHFEKKNSYCRSFELDRSKSQQDAVYDRCQFCTLRRPHHYKCKSKLSCSHGFKPSTA